MAAQIHMAGRIWTRVSRQLVNRVFTPWKSMANPPTSRARGANHRLRWLRASTAVSTVSSSPCRIASTRLPKRTPTWPRRVVRRRSVAVSGGAGSVPSALGGRPSAPASPRRRAPTRIRAGPVARGRRIRRFRDVGTPGISRPGSPVRRPGAPTRSTGTAPQPRRSRHGGGCPSAQASQPAAPGPRRPPVARRHPHGASRSSRSRFADRRAAAGRTRPVGLAHCPVWLPSTSSPCAT